MKKIIWLYPKLEKWMGGTRYVFECCKELSDRYEVLVICQSSSRLILDEFENHNIKVVDLKSYTFTDLKFWILFSKTINSNLKEIENLADEGDIIISSMFPMNVIAHKMKNKHIQIIYEPFSFFYSHNIWKDFSIFHHLFFKITSLFFRRYDIEATKGADSILTLSQYERKNIHKVYNLDSDIIYEGVNTDFFKPRDSSYFHNKYPDCFPIMHSTGFDSYKGTDLVIDSLPEIKKSIPNFKIFITYTRENKSALKKYKNFISNNNLDKNVVFLGLIPYEQLPVLYSFVDIYLEPGIGRSMSLSNKEAMSCGTPVIAGQDAFEEINNGYNGFLIDSSSKKELVDKVCIIYNSYNNSNNSYSENALNSITKKFTWKAVTKKICHQIENL